MSAKSNFYVYTVHQMMSGLNIQLIHRHHQNTVFENCDYRHSLCVSEDAFWLIEPIFIRYSSLSDDVKWAYHYGFHIHSREQVGSILLELENLLNDYIYGIFDECPKILNQKIDVLQKVIKFLKHNLHHYEYGILVLGI